MREEMMEKPTLIQVRFEELTRSDYLGEGVTLPYTDELKEALQVVQTACQAQVDKSKKEIRNEWLARKWHELRQLMDSDGQKAIEILNEIADYEKSQQALIDTFKGLGL